MNECRYLWVCLPAIEMLSEMLLFVFKGRFAEGACIQNKPLCMIW